MPSFAINRSVTCKPGCAVQHKYSSLHKAIILMTMTACSIKIIYIYIYIYIYLCLLSTNFSFRIYFCVCYICVYMAFSLILLQFQSSLSKERWWLERWCFYSCGIDCQLQVLKKEHPDIASKDFKLLQKS